LPENIITEDHEQHIALRRTLAPSFSDRSMREQEPIISHYIDLLIRRLHEHCVDRNRKDEKTGLQAKKALNMGDWYNWTTFDVIGDLAFGEPFGCLDKAKYDPWVRAINESAFSSSVLVSIKQLGLGRLLLVPWYLLSKARAVHERRTEEKLARRMEKGIERPDLIEELLKRRNELVRNLFLSFCISASLTSASRVSTSESYARTPVSSSSLGLRLLPRC